MGINEHVVNEAVQQHILDNTLIRRIELFNPDQIECHRNATLQSIDGKSISFIISSKQLPETIPTTWNISRLANDHIYVEIDTKTDVLFSDQQAGKVTSAGQVPSGFNPEACYPSRNHPRGLQLTIFAASDALRSIGIDWEVIRQAVKPDEIAVFSGSAMGQLDVYGSGGMLQAPWQGRRPTAKQVALGLPEMSADFANAYVLGSLGANGASIGACATFLYNVKTAIDEIKSGNRRIALAGGAEAPVIPEIIESYRIMGALAEDKALMDLDHCDTVDNRRACRPFSSNVGFTLAEAASFIVFMDDELAIELGAQIYGAVPDVFINADGFKKSISSPGVGNYITMGKSLALARSMFGERCVQRNSYIHAHGTGTPQNRTSESRILNETAKSFRIEKWNVAAVKAYLGHTLAAASGDQISAALGSWQYGLIPGIYTIDHIAEDVYASHLRITPEHIEIDPREIDVVFINSKGFGGNNATGVLISPFVTHKMLTRRYGSHRMAKHARHSEQTLEHAEQYDDRASRGNLDAIYRFGEGVIDGTDLKISDQEIGIPGYSKPIDLNLPNAYTDMT